MLRTEALLIRESLWTYTPNAFSNILLNSVELKGSAKIFAELSAKFAEFQQNVTGVISRVNWTNQQNFAEFQQNVYWNLQLGKIQQNLAETLTSRATLRRQAEVKRKWLDQWNGKKVTKKHVPRFCCYWKRTGSAWFERQRLGDLYLYIKLCSAGKDLREDTMVALSCEGYC